MRFLRNMSLRAKLVAMGTTFLLLWCGLYAVYIPYKVSQITATWFEERAGGVAAALESGVRPALEFDDARAVDEQFKVLAPKLNLKYVGVFRGDGVRLGGYRPELAGETLMPPSELRKIPMNGTLRVEDPIDGKDGRLGTLVLGMSPDEIQSDARLALGDMALFSAIALFLGIVGASIFGSWLVRPIENLAYLANRIATGDLAGARKILAESDDDAADEVGRLRASFRTMVTSLTDAVGTLQRTGAELSLVGTQLANLTERQTDTISRQAAALQETQVTADEIKQTSALATRKAEAVLEAASNADQLGQTGEEALGKSVSGLEEIRQHVASIAAQITALNSRAMQIGGITNTVKELADQSNLLALNAAIEAARSGEHGRAFSVVAREIRSLADESIQSTVRVGEILSAFAGDARDGVGIAERGMSRVDAGITQVRTSGEHLRQLAAIIQDNSVSARQIAAAVNQQNAGIEQIFNALAELSQMMADTVTGVEEARGSTVALNSVARQISEVVERYRV